MGKRERQELIKAIEEERGSRLLVYITADRTLPDGTPIGGQIAIDALPIIYSHLLRMGHQEKIKELDLYLYSTGGTAPAGYALVNLIRLFCHSFNVIVPFKAFSCATLIALGANKIIMSRTGLLSPIGPVFPSPFGLRSIDDVLSYLELAKKEAGIGGEEGLSKVFDKLLVSVPPLILGASYRAKELVKFYAKTLTKNVYVIEKFVDTLIELPHEHLIGYEEAKNLGLNVINPPRTLEEKIMRLFNEYNSILHLGTPFDPEELLGSANQANIRLDLAIIESDNLTHVYRTTKIRRVMIPQPGSPAPLIAYQMYGSWVEDNAI